MSIISRPSITLFSRHINKVLQDQEKVLGPRVHNKHHKTAPADAVYIGRGSPWGNPYVIGVHGDRATVIRKFELYVLPTLDLEPLRGKHLICFCKPQACHGDSLLEAANR